jgi:predicted DsbA family dithiol-disulfide isomerase
MILKEKLRIFPWWAITISLAFVHACSPVDTREVLQEQIRLTIQDDPQLILEALRGREMELSQMVDLGRASKQTLDKRKARLAELSHPYQPLIEESRPIRGNVSAPITIIEYADFECPFCAQAHKTITALLEQHDGQLRFIYKHNPIDQIHPMARHAARWFEAVAKQSHDKAWKFHDRIYQAPGVLREGQETLEFIAASLGVDMERAARDIDS